MAKGKEKKELRDTLLRLAVPGVSPADMLKSARKEHPDASKKEILLAAFDTLIDIAEQDEEKAKQLHDFAITQRGE